VATEFPVSQEHPELVLPLILFSRYMQFLARRPISESNLHYRSTRVAGLRSLLPILAEADHPALAQVTDLLRALTPANLVRIAPDIQRALRVFREPFLPRRVLSRPESPDAEFFSGVRRVLILIGPAIGIGDEIIMFSLPRGLKTLLPDADVTVSSSYPQMWDHVDQVNHVRHYTGLRNLLESIRSAEYDLLVMVDFETPGLASAIARESSVSRYVEIALGARQVIALDNSRHLHWRMPETEPYYRNYYDCVEAMLHWLGAPRDISTEGLMHNTPVLPAIPGELNIFVNPFTSKEDPSERYWGQLLCSVLPASLRQPVAMAINTGPSLATRSLAYALGRRAQARYSDRSVRVDVPHQHGKPGIPLGIGDVFTHSNHADVVITADSFPAHAAQLYRRLTIVLGKPLTEPWRSPSPASFYFWSTDPLPSVAAAIQRLFAELLADGPPQVLLSHIAEFRRRQAALEAMFASPSGLPDKAACMPTKWAELCESQQELLRAAQAAGSDYQILFGDNNYDELLPPMDGGAWTDVYDCPELWWHHRRRFREWQNSNLAKYVLKASIGANQSIQS